LSKYSKPYCVKNKIIKKFDKNNRIDDNSHNKTQNDFGFLEISVYHNVVNEPIEYAKINISLLTISGLYKEKGLGTLITKVATGVNGYAPLIQLPTLNKLQSNKNKDEIKMYNIIIQAEGYHSAYIFDVQIYPNITTSYRIHLRHIYEHEDHDSLYEFIIEPTIPGH